MAVPAYATDLVDITTSFTTGWSLISEGGGGQNAISAPETDDFIQGTECVSRNPFSTSVRGIIYDKVTTVAVAADDAVFIWWKADVAQALDTKAGGGIRLVIGISTTAYRQYFVAGNDNYALGGWRCTPIDPTNAGDLNRGTPGSPPYSFFGVAFDVPGAGPSKGFPFKIDMIRHGRTIDVTAGEIANPATIDALTTHADGTVRRWGIIQGTDTGATQQGIINWGTGATAVYSRDNGRAITLVDTEFAAASFTQIIFNNASTDVVWDTFNIQALGTNNRGIITINNNATVTISNSSITGINTTADGGTNSVWDGTKWNGCNAVTSNGGSFLGCEILVPTVAIDSSAFIYNVATDTDGKLDDMSFSKGVNAHHAIELGLNSPLSVTFRSMNSIGFSATNNVNDSTIYVKRTTGTVTINLVDCTGNFSYKTDGATVVIVANPVTTTITVRSSIDNSLLEGSTVLLHASDGTGDLPYLDSVSLTRSGTTVTVSHTGHGLVTGNYVIIRGTDQSEYKGVFEITFINVNSYTYQIATTPTSPATGTPTATGVVIFGETPLSGQLSDTRTFSVNQNVTGWARKASTSPYFREFSLAGNVINSSSGLSLNILLISDE